MHPYFENFILVMIILSSLKLVVDTYIDPDNEDLKSVASASDKIDYGFNIIFATEALSKVIAFGFFLDRGSYLRETWSQLDFFIVLASLVDMSF